MTLVRDVMTTDPVVVPVDATIDVAIDLMLTHRVSGLPVVDSFNGLVGVLSEYDVLQLLDELGSNASGPSPDKSPVASRLEPCENYMSRNVKTIQADASLEIAASIFRAATLRRLMVLDRDKLAGVISRRDIIRYIRDRRTPGEVPSRTIANLHIATASSKGAD